jgi:uncharacterized membrane protein YesL
MLTVFLLTMLGIEIVQIVRLIVRYSSNLDAEEFMANAPLSEFIKLRARVLMVGMLGLLTLALWTMPRK